MSFSESNDASSVPISEQADDIWQRLGQLSDGEGLVSFRDYMETVLYSPAGYYERRVKLGGLGADFYTSAQFPLFGMTVGHYIRQLHQSRPSEPLYIVEFGPGQGELALQICSSLLADVKLSQSIHYIFVETSEKLRQLQQEKVARLADEIDFTWYRNGNVPKRYKHVYVIGNEFLDALPVERLCRTQSGFEQAFVRVDVARRTVSEVFLQAPASLADAALRYTPIRPGHSAELCLQFGPVFKTIAGLAETIEGVFFDYGIFANEWESGFRPEGTLRAFRQHKLCSPFEFVGDADITADVNWDLVRDIALANGLEVEICAQGSFLMKHGITAVAEQLVADGPRVYKSFDGLSRDMTKTTLALKQLVMPGGMGERFDAFVFRKDKGGVCSTC